MTTFKISNIKKKTHKKWKMIADIALYALPLLTGIVTQMPVSDSLQKWILVILNVSIVAFKALSKFTTDENTNENS